MKRYDMVSEYNATACEDQVRPVEDTNGRWVRYEDAAALAAQVEALRDAGNEVYAEFQQWALSESHEETNRVFKLWLATRAATPQHHLREVRAEAVKKEFGSILHSVANQFTGDDTTNPWHNGANHVFVLFAKEIDKRVKSIRQGEVE